MATEDTSNDQIIESKVERKDPFLVKITNEYNLPTFVHEAAREYQTPDGNRGLENFVTDNPNKLLLPETGSGIAKSEASFYIPKANITFENISMDPLPVRIFTSRNETEVPEIQIEIDVDRLKLPKHEFTLKDLKQLGSNLVKLDVMFASIVHKSNAASGLEPDSDLQWFDAGSPYTLLCLRPKQTLSPQQFATVLSQVTNGFIKLEIPEEKKGLKKKIRRTN